MDMPTNCWAVSGSGFYYWAQSRLTFLAWPYITELLVDLDSWLNLAAAWACSAQVAQVLWGCVLLGSLSCREKPPLASAWCFLCTVPKADKQVTQVQELTFLEIRKTLLNFRSSFLIFKSIFFFCLVENWMVSENWRLKDTNYTSVIVTSISKQKEKHIKDGKSIWSSSSSPFSQLKWWIKIKCMSWILCLIVLL